MRRTRVQNTFFTLFLKKLMTRPKSPYRSFELWNESYNDIINQKWKKKKFPQFYFTKIANDDRDSPILPTQFSKPIVSRCFESVNPSDYTFISIKTIQARIIDRIIHVNDKEACFRWKYFRPRKSHWSWRGLFVYFFLPFFGFPPISSRIKFRAEC